MPKDNLKDLPPEERIKRLKQLEEEKKKEIEEGKKIIKRAHDELTDRQKWLDKVPIPQLAQDDAENLSEEGKEILKTGKGVAKKKVTFEEEVEEQAEKEEEEQVGLEEIAREVSNIPASGNVSYGLPEDSTPEQLQPEYFAQQTAYSPAQEVRERVERIWDYSQERDMTWREQQEVTGIVSGLERKADAGASGKYTSWSEEVAQEVILSKKIASQLLLTKSYDSSKSERGVQQDWYKGN